MLIGAVFGWAVLSPLAKKNGWAPGPVGDWEKGSRGWIIWIALVIMLMDASINLGWFAIKSILRYLPRQKFISVRNLSSTSPSDSFLSSSFHHHSNRPTTPVTYYSATSAAHISAGHHEVDDLDDAPPEHLVSNRAVLVLFILSLALCVFAMQISFSSVITPGLSVLAVSAAVVLSIMGVRATGQTDLNPASSISKITQVFFALFTAPDNPHRILINLLAGQVADAGAGQAGDMMQDLKTGHLLRASPKAQFYGALVGSMFGAIVAPAVYRMYTAGYELPGPVFPMPQAFIWIFTARLLAGEGLPASIAPFAISAMVIFSVFTVLRIFLGNHKSESIRKWQSWVPGGIPVAIGMYNPPSFTLARAVGGMISLWCLQRRKMDCTTLTIVASGFILGEGIVSLVNLTLAFLGVPHL